MECERAAAETGGQGGLQTASPRFKKQQNDCVHYIQHSDVLQTGLAPDCMNRCVQDERQKQQDEEWQEMKRQREGDLDAKEAADRELEERKQQQGEQLAAVKAKLDALKAQKQDMVEKLKQVPPHATLRS